MKTFHPKFVVDKDQQRHAVLLTVEEWEQIVEELEELDDIRAYDAAKSGPQESIPFQDAIQELQGER